MSTPPLTGLSATLAAPQPVDLATLAEAWYDQDITLTLVGPGRRAPPDLAGHLRRSFLGAMGPAASGAARAGLPCTWDPPCALDVFCREQLRLAGDGLPKPYVLALEPLGEDLLVTLRVFGMANDWAMAAAEALAAGVSGILPWARVVPGLSTAPVVADRRISPGPPLPPVPEGPVVLRLMSPLDISGGNPRGEAADPAARLVARMVRRVDAMARWQGMSLTEAATRDLTAAAHGLRTAASGLQDGRHASPNRKGQVRNDPVMTGWLRIARIPAPLWPILHLATRTHIGRHATEGLGAFRICLVSALL